MHQVPTDPTTMHQVPTDQTTETSRIITKPAPTNPTMEELTADLSYRIFKEPTMVEDPTVTAIQQTHTDP